MTAPSVVIACPCGGHRFTLAADRLPVGGRAAFTCPACGLRRSCRRTDGGVVVDDLPVPDAAAGPSAVSSPTRSPAAALPPPVADDLPPPSPVPPAVRIALAVMDDTDWRDALARALPPGWHVLCPGTAAQALADFLALAPDVVLVDDGEAGRTIQTAVDALPGRSREGLTLLALVPGPDGDSLAAFAHSADAVLDVRDETARTERLQAALARAAALPSLFTGERG